MVAFVFFIVVNLFRVSLSADVICDLAFECANTTTESTKGGSTSIYARGYKSHYGSTSTLLTSDVVQCMGAFSCFDVLSITAEQSISCAGSNACAKVSYIHADIALTGNGVNALTSSTISTTPTVRCEGEQSCAYAIIKGSSVIEADGAYSLLNAVIDSNGTGTLDINLYGYYAGFGSTITCITGDSCTINCAANACTNVQLNCDNNCAINYITADTVRAMNHSWIDISSILLYDSESMTKTSDSECSAQPDNMTYDDNSEATAGDIIASSGGPLCCRGMSACQNANNIQYTSPIGQSIVSSGHRGISGSDIESNGAVFCDGDYGCIGASISTTENVYCTGDDACYSALKVTAPRVYCSGREGCYYSSFVSDGNDMEVYLTGHRSGFGASITCNVSDTCSIWCFGYKSCESMTLVCDGLCNLYCDADSVCPDGWNANVERPPIATTAPPTTGGTLTPSVSPTSMPSFMPSVYPTVSPSFMPSVNPTTFPSLMPSQYPTVTPTLPTVAPSKYPTTMPSLMPSKQPTPLLSPTTMPSTMTAFPSLTPSKIPTTVPSLTPSNNPTTFPSLMPSVDPTSITSFPSLPSSVPSVDPTQSPSFTPSQDPTVFPSLMPSKNPTIFPSLTPSTDPTSFPSFPSATPSVDPTQSPSFMPSKYPTTFPSSVPAKTPTLTPTAFPTTFPSLIPSKDPTAFPSFIPSLIPSITPTISPTVIPSLNPTTFPSVSPSVGTLISTQNTTPIQTSVPLITLPIATASQMINITLSLNDDVTLIQVMAVLDTTMTSRLIAAGVTYSLQTDIIERDDGEAIITAYITWSGHGLDTGAINEAAIRDDLSAEFEDDVNIIKIDIVSNINKEPQKSDNTTVIVFIICVTIIFITIAIGIWFYIATRKKEEKCRESIRNLGTDNDAKAMDTYTDAIRNSISDEKLDIGTNISDDRIDITEAGELSCDGIWDDEGIRMSGSKGTRPTRITTSNLSCSVDLWSNVAAEGAEMKTKGGTTTGGDTTTTSRGGRTRRMRRIRRITDNNLSCSVDLWSNDHNDNVTPTTTGGGTTTGGRRRKRRNLGIDTVHLADNDSCSVDLWSTDHIGKTTPTTRGTTTGGKTTGGRTCTTRGGRRRRRNLHIDMDNDSCSVDLWSNDHKGKVTATAGGTTTGGKTTTTTTGGRTCTTTGGRTATRGRRRRRNLHIDMDNDSCSVDLWSNDHDGKVTPTPGGTTTGGKITTSGRITTRGRRKRRNLGMHTQHLTENDSCSVDLWSNEVIEEKTAGGTTTGGGTRTTTKGGRRKRTRGVGSPRSPVTPDSCSVDLWSNDHEVNDVTDGGTTTGGGTATGGRRTTTKAIDKLPLTDFDSCSDLWSNEVIEQATIGGTAKGDEAGKNMNDEGK